MKKRKKDIRFIRVDLTRLKTILFILAVIFFINNTVLAKEEIPQPSTQTISYTVSQGETVWNIAKQFRRGKEDIRQTIKRIEKDNNLKDATIYPGQELNIKIEL